MTKISWQALNHTDIYYDKNGNVRDIYYAGGYKEYYQYDEFGQLTTLKTNRDRTYLK